MNRSHLLSSRARVPIGFALALACLAGGCARETVVNGPDGSNLASSHRSTVPGVSESPVLGPAQPAPPSGLTEATFGGHSIRLWPYTGASFDGSPSDPMNLLFVGEADPVAIRDALLSLDGDRTALGFPAVYPFNALWSDAVGDAQTGYAEGSGWTGSVIQLQLGVYEPLRVHLRLFRTSQPFGDGTWTLGAAHLEVLIPGTADHQVLSWELAEQIVAADLVRSGLLDPGAPSGAAGPLNQAPSFRDIPAIIYNELPPELIALIGGPAPPVGAAVPIPNDGQSTVLHLAGRAPSAGPRTETFTITYEQVVPRPFCSSGPTDWILVQGPVTFHKSASVDASGRYAFDSRYSGRLTGTPYDITATPPAPAGDSFEALVGETQRGDTDPTMDRLSSFTRRLVPGQGGTEFVTSQLRVGSDGQDRFEAREHCQ